MKKFVIANCVVGLLIAGLSSGFASRCVAQDDAPAKLPTADQVIARYLDVTGGAEKYKAIKTLRQSGTLSIPAAGITGSMKVAIAGPNKVSINVELPGAGNESNGTNGETTWSDSTMTGTRLVTGEEAEQIKMEADFRRFYEPTAVYKSLEIKGVKDIDGEKCYEMLVTKKSGDTQTEYYSIKTGLQTHAIVTAHSAMGEMEIEATTSDYKEVDGIKFPHKMTQKLPTGMEIIVTFDEIEVNPELPADTFAMPESIQKLVDQQKEKPSDQATDDSDSESEK